LLPARGGESRSSMSEMRQVDTKAPQETIEKIARIKQIRVVFIVSVAIR
jgi:hypothetical protein